MASTQKTKAKQQRAPRTGPGRYPHVPTPQTHDHVKMMTRGGVRQDRQWEKLGISEGTYRKYYLEDFKKAFEEANEAVAQTSLAVALGMSKGDREPNPDRANPMMLKFWAQAHMGWSEKSAVEHSGSVGIRHEDALEELK